MELLFSETKLVFKDHKGTQKPEVQREPEVSPKQKKSKKEKIEKKYKQTKTEISERTQESMTALRQNMTLEMFAKGINTVKRLREKISRAPIGLIEKIEDKYPGITLAAFTSNLEDKKKLDLKNWSSDEIYSNFKEKTKYKIDFLGNDDAEKKWGLADMLSITMRKVTKYERGNGNLKRVSFRRTGLKGQNKPRRGFYDNRGYMAVHSGDVFEFENSNPEFNNLFREKEADKYKEIDEKSYGKYEDSKYAKQDREFFKETPRREPEREAYIPDASKRDMIARGSTPFEIRPGYRLTKEEYDWYKSARREAYRIGRMDINQRLDILQQRYNFRDALDYAADMVGIRDKDKKYFIAMNDAVLRVESNYNPYNFNARKKAGAYEIALSTAAGEYQILNSVWKEMRKFSENSRKGKYLRRQLKKYGINPDMLMKIDFNAPRPEQATPFQRCIAHNLFMFRYSRILKRLESIDNIYEKLRTTEGRTRRSWMRAMYLYWRNGPGGAAALIRNLRRGIPLPETKQEARDYFNTYLRSGDWQKKRGFNDFWTVMRVTKKFADRFQQNLDQLS